MLEAIFAKDVQAGWTILLSGGTRIDVVGVEVNTGEAGTCVFILAGNVRLTVDPFDIIALAHRPWPQRRLPMGDLESFERMIARQVVCEQGAAITSVGASNKDIDARLALIRDVIHAYFLGQSSSTQPRKEGE